MTSQDKYLKEVFPRPPLTAFRRENNLRSLLIRAKIPQERKKYPERKVRGMQKCTKMCPACPFILETKDIKVNKKETWKLNKKFTCESFNIIYMIQCDKEKCNMRYIGQTERGLKFRLAEHRGYVTQGVINATGSHFRLPGHSVANLKITVVEQVKKKDRAYREKREEYHINKFNTFYDGLNKQQ